MLFICRLYVEPVYVCVLPPLKCRARLYVELVAAHSARLRPARLTLAAPCQLKGEAAVTAVCAALGAGYRSIDTASVYRNEEEAQPQP